MNFLSTVRRIGKIVSMVDYAAGKLPVSGYYPIALSGPILVNV